MLLLVLGLLVFFAPHVFTTMRDSRAALIARIGEGPYKGLYSLVSAAGLALIVFGWSRAPFVPVWQPPVGMRHLAMALMLPALVMVVAAYVPGRIKTALKHPMLAGIKLWATAHLLANGDLAGMLLFGSFLAFGVYDRIAVKRRAQHGDSGGSGPPIPNRGLRNDVVAIVIGVVVYLAILFWLHEAVIRRPLL